MWLFEFVVSESICWWRHNTNPGYRVQPKCCVVCSSSIYGFWLPHWYLQALLAHWIDSIFITIIFYSTNTNKHNNFCNKTLFSYRNHKCKRWSQNNQDRRYFRTRVIIQCARRAWRYQWGNQNPYIEEEQTTQWPKEKGQKDKQQSTKHRHETDLSSNGRDESNEMSDRYEHTAVYPTGFGALKPPTSYNSIQGKEINKYEYLEFPVVV
jgi:hypothetical protein